MLDLPGLIYDDVKRLRVLLHVISFKCRIVATCKEFSLIFNNFMKRYRDKVVKFRARSPAVPNSAILISCIIIGQLKGKPSESYQ